MFEVSERTAVWETMSPHDDKKILIVANLKAARKYMVI